MEKKKDNKKLVVGMSIALGLFCPLIILLPALAGVAGYTMAKRNEEKKQEEEVEIKDDQNCPTQS